MCETKNQNNLSFFFNDIIESFFYFNIMSSHFPGENSIAASQLKSAASNNAIITTTSTLSLSSHYTLTYPFHSLDANDIVKYSKIVGKWFAFEENIYSSMNISPMNNNESAWKYLAIKSNFLALMKSLMYLKEHYYIDVRSSKFLDCLGYGGSAVFVALSFDMFTEFESIEFSEEGCRYGNQVLSNTDESIIEKKNKRNISFRCGSAQDYFSFDATVVYMNCTIFNESMVDELPLISLILRLSGRLQPGSFLIIVTTCMRLDTASCEKLGFGGFDCVLSQELEVDSDVQFIWILKTKTIISTRRK